MTKELSIKTIKKELMDALLGDMRIINSFSNKDKRKASDYIGTNIFGHLNESIRSYHVDTYINFDVAKREDKFDVYICIKTHKDLLSKSNGNNCLDNISKYIEEIINELYPDRKVFVNTPVLCESSYETRYVCFSLFNNDNSIDNTTDFEKVLGKQNANVGEAIMDNKANLGKSLKEQLTDACDKFSKWISESQSVMDSIKNIKSAIEEINEIDDALVELQKVSDDAVKEMTE